MMPTRNATVSLLLVLGCLVMTSRSLSVLGQTLHSKDASADAAAKPVSALPNDWKLETLSGGTLTPFAKESDRVWVLVFISPDCPIANAYHPSLEQLARDFDSRGVHFVLVHANTSTTVEQARQHRREYDLKLPIVLDNEQRLARQLQAKATPEVFVMASGNRQPLYRGKIDNWYQGYGKKRPRPTDHYLRQAIEATLAQRPVETSVTEPVGCYIEYSPSATGDETSNDAVGDQESLATLEPYDPDRTVGVKSDLQTWRDETRNREIPVRLYYPGNALGEPAQPLPIIVMSHGLGGTRDGCRYLGEHWAGRGYLVVALQHAGSDEQVWKSVPRRQILEAMRKAATAENLEQRVADVHFALDQLRDWDQDPGHAWFERLDLEHVGMTGHSFGAVTTQAIAGQRYLGKAHFRDSRVDAALALSPSAPRLGSAQAAFEEVSLPWFSMTGTRDEALIGGATPADRTAVYQALPDGDKYELVLDGAQHHAFGDTQRLGARSRNPKHHQVIRRFSTAFWDAYLRDNQQARKWLTSKEATGLLDPDDQWRQK